MSFSSLLRILLCGAFLAGCGELPRPFKSDRGSGAESPLVAMQDSVGVVVAPVSGAPPGVSGPLADILAEALRRTNVPATTAGSVKTAYLLEGEAQFAPVGADRGTVAIGWTITDAEGETIDRFETRQTVSSNAWWTARRIALNAVAGRAAPRIASVLQTRFEAAETAQRPTIGVVAIEGAPGDGNAALKQAFTAVLKNAGLPVAAEAGEAAIQVFGNVAVTDLAPGREKLEIVWILRRSDGSELGRMTQANAVEKGRATARWGPLAYDVTLAMVESVAEVLLTMERADDIRLGR